MHKDSVSKATIKATHALVTFLFRPSGSSSSEVCSTLGFLLPRSMLELIQELPY